MAQDLSREAAEHDNVFDPRHDRDKAAKKRRLETSYEAVPAVETVAGSRVIDGIFRSPIKGFSFVFLGGEARKAVDPAAYTRSAIEMSKQRAKFKRVRLRDGKEVKDTGRYKHGAVTLMTTLPPWSVRAVERLGPSELEHLMLHLASKQAEAIETASGRPAFGGACHFDTAVPHFATHLPKSSPDGVVYPKADFRTTNSWNVGTRRIEKKFPGLMTPRKLELLKGNMEAYGDKLPIEMLASDVIDNELEKWIKSRGFELQYEADCKAYFKAKKKAQNEEPLKPLMQAALGHFHRHLIFPIAYSAMSFAMWRMIPRAIRPGVMLSMRAKQVIRSPIDYGVRQGKQLALAKLRVKNICPVERISMENPEELLHPELEHHPIS